MKNPSPSESIWADERGRKADPIAALLVGIALGAGCAAFWVWVLP